MSSGDPGAADRLAVAVEQPAADRRPWRRSRACGACCAAARSRCTVERAASRSRSLPLSAPRSDGVTANTGYGPAVDDVAAGVGHAHEHRALAGGQRGRPHGLAAEARARRGQAVVADAVGVRADLGVVLDADDRRRGGFVTSTSSTGGCRRRRWP